MIGEIFMKKYYKILLISFLFLITFTGANKSNESLSIENYSNAYASNNTSNQKQIKNLSIFIKFKDSDLNVDNHLDDVTSVNNALKIYNSDTFEMNTVNGIISVPSFKTYYERQSYGALSITTEILPKINGKITSYEDSHPIGYYLSYSDKNTIGYKNQDEARKREEELVNNASLYVSQNITGINSSELDTDSDGIIDAISFVVEGQKNLPSSISWNDLLWSHMRSNTGIKSTILGKKVVSYTLLYAADYTESASLFSLNRGTYSTIIHEFGHSLGFMDLYRYGSQAKPLGFYDIMGLSIGSNPQNFLAYNVSEYNAKTNWHSPLPVVKNTTNGITLYKPTFTDKNEKRAIKVLTNESSKEYFVIEYYAKQNTYDTYTPDESGIIVYRVNENNKTSGNTGTTTNGESDHLYVFRPNETTLGAGMGDLTKATLNMKRPKLGKKFDLTNMGFDNESIYYADGSNSGIIITVTSETESSINFNIEFPDVLGSGTKENPYVISDVKTFLYLMQNDTKNKYYKLANDLDFSSITNYPKIDFTGYLNGNNKTVRNIKSNYGLFASVGDYGTNSIVENLFIENITATGNGDYLGGFTSVASSATIRNVHIKSGQVKNVESFNSLSSTGGFVGNVYNDVTIENCSSNAAVSSPKNASGFIGLNQNAIIKRVFVTGSVSGSSNVGTVIALQSISDSTYNVPQAVYYELKDSNIKSVGGYSAIHDLNVLPSSSLTKGINSLSVPKQLNLNVGASVNYNVSINLEHSISASNTNASYNNGKIVGKTAGNSQIYMDFSVGSLSFRMTTDVSIKSGTSTTTTIKPTTTTKKPTTTTKKPTTTTKKPTTTTKKPTTTTKKPTTTTKKPTTTTKKPPTTTKKPTTTAKKPTTTTKKVVPIKSVKINQGNISLGVNKTSKLTATINPGNTTQSKALTWTSSNKKIATVDKYGNVKGIKAGTANITVKTSNGKTHTIKVTVKKPTPIKSIKLNKKILKLELNKTYQLKATINPSSTTDSKVLTWSTSNKKVAIVDKNGKITAVGGGSATITVTTSNKKKAKVKVTVSKINAKKATITAIKNQIQTGKALKPYVQVKLNGKVLKNGKDYTVTYKNNKKAGKATVTVKFKGNYTGTKTDSFIIIPSKVNIKNPSTSKKSITVKYSKVSGAKTYQTAYRLKGTNKWSYTTKSKISKLTSGKEYEVMIRAGIKNGKNTIYGTWSNVKTIKVK